MVQGLAFLSKKSWHTKNLANQEKVWMAEERKAAEESKTKELAKQIQQEREQEELDKIAGRKSHRKDRGIDWMYQGGTGEAAQEDAMKQAEEFLMGKEYVPVDGKVKGDFALEEGGVNSIIANVSDKNVADQSVGAAAFQEPSVADRNEAFRMRVEDPMFLVGQKQREKQTQHDKTRALYERVVGPTTAHREEQDDANDRGSNKEKERKRDRKHHRRHDQDDRGDRKRRHRSNSRERSSRHRDSSQRHHRQRSSSQSEERYRTASPKDRNKPPNDFKNERSQRDNHSRRRSQRSESPKQDYRHYDRLEESKSSPRRQEHSSTYRPGYGLQHGQKLSNNNNNSSIMAHDLGPNRELLDKKRQAKDEARRHHRDNASTRRRMTDEERAYAVRAMQADASKRDALLNQAVASRRVDHDQESVPSRGNASFLQDMVEETHGIKGNVHKSLASRVAQKRHTNQKLADSFL